MRRRIVVIMIVQLWHVMVYGDYDCAVVAFGEYGDISLIKALLPEAYLAQVLLILTEHQVVLHLNKNIVLKVQNKSIQTENLFHCDHLVARGYVLKDFQLSQEVVRKLHIGDALFFV